MRVKGVVTKLFLVNAENPWAIQCIERLLGEDQRVSATCECVMVFRECSMGLRGELAEQISFQEFVTVIVDRNRFLNDSLAIEAFQRATSNVRQLPAPAPRVASPPPRKVRPATTRAVEPKAQPEPKKTPVGAGYARVAGVLTGLGYRGAQFEPILKNLSVDFENGDINEIVHVALQKLAA